MRVLFKKIDSLWRGNVGAEVAALTGLGYHVLIAGALPQLRRTVVDGRPYADGVPLAETGLWKAEAAAPPSRLADVLGQDSVQGLDLAAVRSPNLAERLLQLFSRGDAVTLVADGETEADLEAVVAALARVGLRRRRPADRPRGHGRHRSRPRRNRAARRAHGGRPGDGHRKSGLCTKRADRGRVLRHHRPHRKR